MNPAQREAVETRMQELADLHEGRLTPDLLIEEAKDPESPLHACFEWDTAKASYRYWVVQARQLITSVQVNVKVHRTIVKSVAYVRDPDVPSGKQGYVSIKVLRTDADRARVTICEEFARVAAALERAKVLAKVLGIEEDVDKVLNTVLELQNRHQMPSQTM
jgi:hypothetical protein